MLSISSAALDGRPAAAEAPLAVHLVNDTDEVWNGSLSVKMLARGSSSAGDGVVEARVVDRVVEARVVEASVPARSAVSVPVPGDLAWVAAVFAVLGEAKAERWLGSDLDLVLAMPEISLSVTRGAEGAGVDVRVESSSVLRDAVLLAELIAPDARVEPGFATVVPGEPVTFQVTAPPGQELPTDDAVWSGLLWSDQHVQAAS